MRRCTRTSFTLAVLGAAASCGDDAGPDPSEAAAHRSVRSSLARDTSPEPTPAEMRSLAEGNHDLTLALYAETAQPDASYMISTLSIRTAFAMVYAGARGQTATEMASVLSFDEDQARFHEAMNALDLALQSRELPADEQRDLDPVELRQANAFWGQVGYAWLESYLDVLAESYGAGIEALDLQGQPEASRETVNGWVEERTNDRIVDLLPPGSIRPSTVAVLTNALYFKAPWLSPFPEDFTAPGDFTRADGSTANADYMTQIAEYGWASGSGWTAVELPYRGEALSMVILVPDTGTFVDFDEALSVEIVEDAVRGLETADVDLSLPKFEFETAFTLRDVLMDMGMVQTFTAANLSGMIEGRGLFVDEAYHKTFVAVDESGTEAAAATAVVVGETSAPVAEHVLRVDRPFYFLIRDRATDVWLFFGRVMDPS